MTKIARKGFAAALPLLLVATLSFAADSQSSQATQTADGKKAVKKAAAQAGRMTAGAAIGGKVGKAITGSPVGAVVGIILTPSETGCDPQYETCANR